MKKFIPLSLVLLLLFAVTSTVSAQETLAPDQNPAYAVSRARYMNMADSINEWHGITIDNTYKAIDWMEARKEARAERRAYRRQLNLQRVNWDYGYYDSYRYGNYYPAYPNYYGGFRNYHRRSNSFYLNPWGAGYWWR
ncbi:MAG: hypothetical protein EOO05_07235 [Chitinophagaceae bacterium]|nr:MAG: hypothetical protein EOO05_07235 [Chitinophagaceae bacterium]